MHLYYQKNSSQLGFMSPNLAIFSRHDEGIPRSTRSLSNQRSAAAAATEARDADKQTTVKDRTTTHTVVTSAMRKARAPSPVVRHQ